MPRGHAKVNDRTVAADGIVTRIHEEDFCQALGFPPEHKYQQEGGPLLRDCVVLLREWSTAPVLDLRDFIDGQIFNVLVGNADAHGKNYSMLYQGGQWRLSPFYDQDCPLARPELSKTPAMKIGGSPSLVPLSEKKKSEENLACRSVRLPLPLALNCRFPARTHPSDIGAQGRRRRERDASHNAAELHPLEHAGPWPRRRGSARPP